MNVLDNHITDLDNRIIEICTISPTVEQSSIQESLSSYGWILLDSWIAWRTLRFLLRDQDIKIEIQRKWFQTPSSFKASQIKAVWHFGDNVDSYLNSRLGFGLKYLIDEEIEKKRNSSAHFSGNSIVSGSDHQKMSSYHLVFSNVFLLYEIFFFFLSVSVNLFNGYLAKLIMVKKDGSEIFRHIIENHVVDYEFKIVDLKLVSIIKMEFDLDGKTFCLSFDREGCFLNDGSIRIQNYNVFSNKGYYRDISLIKKALENL